MSNGDILKGNEPRKNKESPNLDEAFLPGKNPDYEGASKDLVEGVKNEGLNEAKIALNLSGKEGAYREGPNRNEAVLGEGKANNVAEKEPPKTDQAPKKELPGQTLPADTQDED